MNKLIVISGCSGGGKSTLLSELNSQGYTVMPEAGREVYKEKYTRQEDTTSAAAQKHSAEEIIRRAVKTYHQAQAITNPKDQLIFFDRSYLECVYFYQQLKDEDANKYDNLISELRYFPIMLITPPWKEIFTHDSERKHSFEYAVAEYEPLQNFYIKCGYQLLEIPKLSVKERCQFVLDNITKN